MKGAGWSWGCFIGGVWLEELLRMSGSEGMFVFGSRCLFEFGKERSTTVSFPIRSSILHRQQDTFSRELVVHHIVLYYTPFTIVKK